MPEAFTIDDVQRVMGKRVKLIRALAGRFDGETGTVSERADYRNGYTVVVRWDIGFASGQHRIDYFTRDEFDEFLREV